MVADVSGVIKEKGGWVLATCIFCRQLESQRHARNNRVSLSVYYAPACFVGVDGRPKGTAVQINGKEKKALRTDRKV